MTHHTKTQQNRRQFLQRFSAGTIGLGLLGPLGSASACSTSGRSLETSANGGKPEREPLPQANPVSPGPENRDLVGRVISRSDDKVFSANGHNAARVERLVFDAVQALVGAKPPGEAFRALFNPRDIVAIKVNCLAGPGLSSSPAVVQAIVKGLNAIGIDHRQIFIWERTSAELEKAGFEINQDSDNKPRCLGVDQGGYEEKLHFSGDVGSLWANVLANRATALINVPVLKDHDLAGIGCALKNMYGAIHNPNRYHEHNCDPYVAQVSAHPFVKDKLRLVLTDALTAQYHGGPARSLAHQWRPAQILAATDPVATDRIAQTLIEAQRKAHGLASLAESNRPPRWLETANKLGLGEHRLEKIKFNQG